MKLLKKVPTIEVKRCFIISDFIRQPNYTKKVMGTVTPAEYKARATKAKKVILELPEGMLDMILKGQWKKRFVAYNKADWYLAEAQTDELGVWRAGGGLPVSWTKGSLTETAEFVSHALKHKPTLLKHRSYTAIPGIMKVALPTLEKEKYLFPIAFKGGTGTEGRKGLPKMKADLDDGCMRSVALAVSGKKKIKVYFGVPKK